MLSLRVIGGRVLANLHAFPTWIAAIFAVVGGIIAIVQYRENSTGSRAKEALEYVNHFFNPPISTAYAKINLFGKEHEKELTQKLSEKSEDAYRTYIINTFRDDEDLNDAALVLVGFFQNLRACTCRSLCDWLLIREFFSPAAYAVNGFIRPVVDNQRERERTFGDGLILLAADHNGKAQDKDTDFLQAYCGAPKGHTEAK
jgi:hypothetical protein